MSGLFVIDKPSGMTSHQVVAAVRRIAGTRKVGHAGTLDPMATGVLLVGVGQATRLLGHLALHDKEYLATVRLGQTTVTDDAEGEVVDVAGEGKLAVIDDHAIENALAQWRGSVQQIPSSVSAIKVDGKRSYARVRAGEQVELRPRAVTISRLAMLDIRRSPGHVDLDVAVECSSGTYVRALARDIGAALGVGGHLTMLRRTRVGAFTLAEAATLDQLAEPDAPSRCLLSLGEIAARCFVVLDVDEAEVEGIRHGRPCPRAVDRVTAMVDPAGDLIALVEPAEPTAKYLAVFAPE